MLAEVEKLEQAMQALLAMLADPQPEGLAVAWQRCGRAQADLQTLLEDSAGLTPEELQQLRSGLESLVRLNAITRGAVQHSQDALAQNLAKTKMESATMKAYSSATASLGESCDLAG